MMPGVAFSIGVLLALAGATATQECVAPHKLVSKMLQRLEDSVITEELPNPSVLLAMNLAGATDSSACKWLLHDIKEDAVKRAPKDMTSGQVALYVLALFSSCENPRHVRALGQTVNLIDILQQKTEEELASLEEKGVPKTTLYSVSLDTLGLCLAGTGSYQKASMALAKQVLSPKNQLSVDTRAMAVLALACTHNQADPSVKNLLWEAVSTVTNGFLNEQKKGNGMIGNIYSMGLALQALKATSKFYAPQNWDCAQAFSVVYSHDYHQPTAIAQVLPALVGKSYLEAASLQCTTSPSKFPILQPELGKTGVHKAALITVHYSIINKLQGEHFKFTTTVHVLTGSTLLKVLQVAAAEKPNEFSFQTEPTSWGPMVVSIHGLAANPNDRTYWQFLSGGNALQQGVGTYKPQNGEHIKAVFSTY
ncbi:cobalamin binding intrinsic factor isoform X1 [Phalacrocorax aristotelis]|uniref:cobalamin binding intrinsic factor isoform X1 n=2 Tax=Phalacrocorax aristotelis TaxID=126867 RepID=UPI003F4B49BA